MADYHRPDSKTLQSLKNIATNLRIHSVKSTNASNSGHPTSCSSAAEIMSVLFFHSMRYKVSEPKDPASDRFVLSKGHAAPILYAAWAEAGLFPVSDLLNLRKVDCDLEGHPTPRLNFIDVATGSLGQGLGFAAGMAYTGKYLDKADYRVFCLAGDGESAEGAMWEALAFASHYKLDNLVAIYDINRLGQSDATALQHDMDTYKRRIEAFGWCVYVVDGHDVEALCKAVHEAISVTGRPACILAKTYKGRGFKGVEDQDGFHGKPLGARAEGVVEALSAEVVGDGPHKLSPCQPTFSLPKLDLSNIRLSAPPNYKIGDSLAVRAAYGPALAKLGTGPGANSRVIALDGDMRNSTFSQKFMDAHPDRYIECYIAEQNMVGVAVGATTRDRAIAFVSTFGAFLTRAYDHIRMGAVSMTNINFMGSHCGCSIGEDGPSQMALEDIAMFRAVPGSTVFYPSEAVSCEYAVELAANTPGICYIRATRPNTPVIYPNDEVFKVGQAKVVRQSSSDQVTVIAAAVTLAEALKAADTLAESGTNIRIIDPFTIKPLDTETIISSTKQTGGRIVTVEDHYPEGGLGDAVLDACAGERDIVVRKLAVTGLPRSGKTAQLLDMFGISAACICRAVKEVLKM